MSFSSYFTNKKGCDRIFSVEAPKIKFGRGSLKEIGDDARALGMTRVAVFTDPKVAQLEAVSIVAESLKSKGLDSVVYDQVAVEPTDISFKQGSKFASEGKFDGFVSIGGGSVMDTCKASNLYSCYPADFLDYVNAPIGKAVPVPGKLKPHIACPTTFGTASECTGIAIFDLLEMEAKTGIVSPMIRADLGVLDPGVLDSLPPLVRAANGFDVFSHACESITARPYTHRPAPESSQKRPLSQGANPYSDITCLEAINLIGRNIVQAVNDPSEENYDALMFAGMLAGIGFGNAGCHLPHGMSYAVAGLVKDYQPQGWPADHPMVPHGISVIVNSPAVFRKTGPACPERHWEAADAMGADLTGKNMEDGGEILADQIISMMRDTGIPNGLSGVGYSMSDLDALTDRSFAQKRLIDNGPLPVARNELKELFHDAMRYW
ncbi:MAG: hydroxyacid-oxoacid transhydrogenase [SAR324 cluster bacterium]|jgi:alcohol dehydrogenase class IV|nr:hydroxyacid-oxoacid transhydrogenase [SAR324 cluster bacterium]